MNDGDVSRIGDDSSSLEYKDILRVSPDTIGGKYLRRFWHPVFIGSELRSGGVKPIRILGEDLTLYRGASGAPHIVARRCPHRGVHLSLGFVKGDQIQCAYHGWQFDADGRCVAQPAEQRPFCDRVKITSYPTREYLGLIFVYMGEGEPPPLPRLADYEDEKLYDCQIFGDIWPCSYFDLLENATDMAHTAFLHWQFGYGIPEDMRWSENECGLFGTFGGTGKQDIFNSTIFDMPTAVEFTPSRAGSVGFFTRGYRVPRDDNTAIRFNLTAIPRVSQHVDRRRKSNSVRQGPSVSEVSAGLVAGLEDMQSLKDRGDTLDDFFLTNVQDCSVLSSLGPPEHRDFTEFLGGTDVSIAKLRRIFLREMAALAEGRPLKEWKRPEYLWPEIMKLHRELAS